MENNNNIISIDDLKTSKRKSRSRKDDLTPAMKQDMISHYIDDTIQNPVGKSPDKKFVCLSPDGIQKLVYEIKDQEVLRSDEAAVLNMLGESIKEHFVNDLDLHMTAKQYKDAVTYWQMKTPTMETPKLIAWKGENCLAFRKLPFELGLGDTPIFDEMMARTSNSEALMCFIGSLFFPESDLQQYVWLQGEGGEGKGALCRFLAKALGCLYSSQTTPSSGDGSKFWTYGIRGARLVVFPDCNNSKWVTSGLFKSLTGGDPIRVEKKGGDIWTESLNTKFIFLSNNRPGVSSQKSDTRRLIYCEMKPFSGKQDARYEARLWKEAGYFISKCTALYLGKYPNHGILDVCSQGVEQLISENEEIYEEYFNEHFELGGGYECLPKYFNNKIISFSKNTFEREALRTWIERIHNLKKTGVKVSGKVIYVYKGVKHIPTGGWGVPSQDE